MLGRLYALKNEVSDLEVVLHHVAHALQQNTLAPDTKLESLEDILVRTKSHLTLLAKALERVVNAWVKGNIKVISRTAIWLKEKALFQRFQNEIHATKETLNLMLGASNS